MYTVIALRFGTFSHEMQQCILLPNVRTFSSCLLNYNVL